jgi:hypothetical protein
VNKYDDYDYDDDDDDSGVLSIDETGLSVFFCIGKNE